MKIADAFKVMATQYRQCRLWRGNTQKVAWIPRSLAVRGKYLRIGNQDGWRVVSCGTIISDAYLAEFGRDWRHQREASDI